MNSERTLLKLYGKYKNDLIKDSYCEFNFDLNNFIMTEVLNGIKMDDKQYIVLDRDNRMNVYKFIQLVKESTSKYCDNILKNVENENNDLHELKFSTGIDNINLNHAEPNFKITFLTAAPMSFNEFKESTIEDLPDCIFQKLE